MCWSEYGYSKFFYLDVTCRKCEGNIGKAVEQEEKLCHEVETVREFTYLGDRVSAGGGCEAAVTAIKRCGWVKFMSVVSCCMLRLLGAVYKSYVRPAMLCRSEARCLKKVIKEFYKGQKDPW